MPDWLYSRSLAQNVRVIERVELWGQAQARVWNPTTNQVVLVAASDLIESNESDRHAVERTLAMFAATRIREALAGEVLAAPLDASVIPLPHQIRALARATSADRVRFLLADEVGLGKTIEAGLILRELKLRGQVKRALVVAPKGLVLQWVEEMQTRFREEFHLIEPADLSAFEQTPWEVNPWQRFPQIVVPMDAIKPIAERRGWSEEQVARHNQTRLDDLLAVGWDLIIVDEAHRVAGSADTIARYQLGKALSAAAPYLLFLTATPHSGKSDSFRRLMNLLDTRDFPLTAELSRARVAPYIVRTEKRRAVDANGNPLFQPRHTRLMPIARQSAHRLEQQLYDDVTRYVRVGYNRARAEKRNYVGFLLLLMQRLVASSTRAIRSALEKRLAVLQSMSDAPRDDDTNNQEWETEWLEADSQEQLDEVIAHAPFAVEDEARQVERLLSLARQCEVARPDAKAEALLDLMLQIEREENDADLKFLIFTEFVATQTMLYEFLTARGYSATMLNGGLGLEERRSVQQDFVGETRILISTDAGGEGLNLQCAHVAINYDLPWSPTKIEQRIGRVDRIGQTHAVRAFNLVIQDSVDHRIQEVLAEKLAVILAEFGVDKTSDILDSAEAETDFDRLYREAVLHPQHIEHEVDELLATIRQRTAEARGVLSILPEDDALAISAASKLASHPLGLWVESLYVNSVLADGGIALRDDNGHRVRRKNETTWESVRFYTRAGATESADAPRLVGLDDARVQALLNQTTRHGAGQPIPSWVVAGLAEGVTGFWSLWRVSLIAGDLHRERVFPLFVHDDGRVLNPSARHVWDVLLRTNAEVQPSQQEMSEPTETIYARIEEIARREGESVYRALAERQNAMTQREREKYKHAFAARRVAIERIGLANVRQKRLTDLENDEKHWTDEMRRKSIALADLEAVVLIHVSPLLR